MAYAIDLLKQEASRNMAMLGINTPEEIRAKAHLLMDL